MKKDIMSTLKAYKESLERDGYNVIYIGLYGSQNYNVADEDSDVDAKAIVMPSLEDIIFRKTISKVREFSTGSCDFKDLLSYYEVVRKGNFSFLEPFYSEWYIGDNYIRDLFRQIPVNKKSILGCMLEKRKAFTHPYPSKTKEFEDFGCDPKQYHHIVRLYHMAMGEKVYGHSRTWPFLKYSGSAADFMISIKRKLLMSIEDTEADADAKIERVRELYKDLEPYKPFNLDREVGEYLRKGIKEGLKNE